MNVTNLHSNRPDKRASWADLCRVVAIFGIVLIHACGAAALYQYGKIPQVDWLSANLLDSLVRCAVPLFVMLSGALLLKRGGAPATIRQIAQRIGKVLFPLLTWNIPFLIYDSYHTETPINLLSMLSKPPMYHLWFVYMIIGIYILLPMLQAIFDMVRDRRDMQAYLLVIWFVVTCVPTYWPIPLLALLQQSSLLGYGGYFIIGGVIASSNRNQVATLAWFLIYAFGVAVTFLLTLHFSEQANAAVETAYTYFSPNVAVTAIAAFVLFTRARVSDHIAKYLQWAGDKTFLVFFMHVAFIKPVSAAISIINLPMFASILLIAFFTFAISLVIAAGIRLIPGSRRIFG
jgi:surface polysaccharide O-acyltransferase-like enzyme